MRADKVSSVHFPYFLGEDEHYANRVFLLYDGIHYDPMGLESNGEIIQTVFPSSNFNVQFEALALAEECKKVRYFVHFLIN